MENMLETIVSRIRLEQGPRFSSFSLRRWIPAKRPAPRDIQSSLVGGFHIIAEFKRGSPSQGAILAANAKAAAIARCYQEGGAWAISVVTEPHFFFGRAEDLKQVCRVVRLPILRKDFIIHPRQVCETYDLGADMVLLIAACLSPGEIEVLYQQALSLGMTPLVEIHSEEELAGVLPLKPRLVGINSRNLKNLSVDWTRTLRLREKVPAGIPVIAESGIRSPRQVETLKRNGFFGALVGEYLLTHADPLGALKELCCV